MGIKNRQPAYSRIFYAHPHPYPNSYLDPVTRHKRKDNMPFLNPWLVLPWVFHNNPCTKKTKSALTIINPQKSTQRIHRKDNAAPIRKSMRIKQKNRLPRSLHHQSHRQKGTTDRAKTSPAPNSPLIKKATNPDPINQRAENKTSDY